MAENDLLVNRAYYVPGTALFPFELGALVSFSPDLRAPPTPGPCLGPALAGASKLHAGQPQAAFAARRAVNTGSQQAKDC